jgi:hypothetical protein
MRIVKEGGLYLFCFFEQEESDLVAVLVKGLNLKSKELIVDEGSATIAGEHQLALRSDHFRLNKFEGPKDGNFSAVSREIKILAQKADGKEFSRSA